VSVVLVVVVVVVLTRDDPEPRRAEPARGSASSTVAGSTSTTLPPALRVADGSGTVSPPCAVTTEARVWCDGFGVPDGLTGVVAVAKGVLFACALLVDTTVQCWGSNDWSQLGVDRVTLQHSDAPLTVPGLSGVTAITAGGWFACALLADASVWCWGQNTAGEIAPGEPDNLFHPYRIDVAPVSSIDAGEHYACAVLHDGTVSCWGRTIVADPISEPPIRPTRVSGLDGVVAVTAGYLSSCALIEDGSVECWGDNRAGTIGDGTYDVRPDPTPVAGLSGVTAISAGMAVCARLEDATVRCWGYNAAGNLGDGTYLSSPVPVGVQGISNAADVAVAGASSCAVLADRELRCWGQMTGTALPTPVG
jgi:alpha-tubulin suppressor-like RCC1 family protein